MPFIEVISQDGSPSYEIPWTPLTKKEQTIQQIHYKRSLTSAEEIFEEVKKWWNAQGKPIPISDAKACLDMIKEEKKQPEPEPERPKTMEEMLGPKPMWGDPLFWDYWRKAKALGFTKDKKK